MKRCRRKPTGSIPQVAETFGYMAGEYGIMNEQQVAIGESTFEGRKELQSEKGLIDCDTLTRLMLERAKTARDAIRIGGELIEKYGWCDEGEALTIADTREVWLMEIVGPGKDAVGAVWAAQRVPDDHVSVVANGSRIGQIDLAKPDFFMASKNVFKRAEELGYWNREERPAVSLLRGLQSREPHGDRGHPARVAGVGFAGAVAETESEREQFPVLGEAGEAGRAGEDHGTVPRHVRGDGFRRGEELDGRERRRADGEEPAGQSVHAVRHEQDAQDQRRLGLDGRAMHGPLVLQCTRP